MHPAPGWGALALLLSRRCSVLVKQTPLGSELQAISVLGGFEFMSVEHFILLKVSGPLN